MVTLEVNIGLDISPRYGSGKLEFEYVKSIIHDEIKRRTQQLSARLQRVVKDPVYDVGLAKSDTENTVVFRMVNPDAEQYAYVFSADLAARLLQDCIAVRIEKAGAVTGALVGEYYHLWGEYNPTYFIRA